MGQDFVFTVPVFADALRYAVGCLTRPEQEHWEGTAILVLGARSVIDAAKASFHEGATQPDEGA